MDMGARFFVEYLYFYLQDYVSFCTFVRKLWSCKGGYPFFCNQQTLIYIINPIKTKTL